MNKKKVIVIGNGVSGTTASIEFAKHSNLFEVTMISGESEYHYSRPALMYIFMGHMRFEDTMSYPASFWKKQDVKLVQDWVSNIDTGSKKVECQSGKSFDYDILILATGSKPNKFGWPGQDLQGVQGLYTLQDLELLEGNVKSAKDAVIVGGGLIGIELAEMLHSRGVHVTFLVREDSYWNGVLHREESSIVNDLIRKEGIELKLSTNLKEIKDNGNGRCRSVVTAETEEEIPCQIVGLTAGVSPNAFLAKDSGIEVNRGIVVDEFFKTSADSVYSIGDCAEINYSDGSKTLDQLWYTGKMQGRQLVRNLATSNNQAYKKPIYYNSAKFIDVEYQIYGQVPKVNDTDTHLYWESDCRTKCVRMVSRGGKFLGLSSLGVRYRQRTCEEWIEKGITVEEAIDDLSSANFDPEFYSKIEKEIAPLFRKMLA